MGGTLALFFTLEVGLGRIPEAAYDYPIMEELQDITLKMIMMDDVSELFFSSTEFLNPSHLHHTLA